MSTNLFRAAMALLLVGTGPAYAQEDYRSLDSGRPIRASDAVPLKLREFEFQLGLRGRFAERHSGAAGAIAFEAGILPNTGLGFEIEPAVERADGNSDAGIAGLSIHVMHAILREAWSRPAFALRLDAGVPVGGALGRDDWGIAGQIIATRRTASGLRLHANAGYQNASLDDGGDAWLVGLASDYALGFSGRMLVAGVSAEVPTRGHRTRLWFETGARIQISNTTVLDLGISTRADQWQNDGANVELIVGISRVLGIRALTPVPVLRPPAIR